MANESIRIRTTPGSSQNIRVKLEQDFDFLEVLSLKITQEDLYQTFCSNYGVVVGRVIANGGFGVPNAKVSIFIPMTDEDSKNVILKDFYPYKTPYQKNPDGIRYNLLLSKQTCILNTPVGTFPSKEDVVDNDTVLEVFEKYYKYTTKTNNSGDFMIFGVPTGQQQIHMDVDLSDIGAISLRPYDMIADGVPEKLFKSKVEFKTSNNLDTLPQINTVNRGIEVIPFWGDPESCEIGITRVDMNINAKITTTSLFIGSMFTDSFKTGVNDSCNITNDIGEQVKLRTGAGSINMIRVSEIDNTEWINGNVVPVGLEDFDIDGGDLIDENGTFVVQLPMNICKMVTDEFGVLVQSTDPEIGIATKGMYRFKMKFTEPAENPKFRSATMFFPSLGRDFGGTLGITSDGHSITDRNDPSGGLTGDANGTEDQRFTTDIRQYNTGNPNLPTLTLGDLTDYLYSTDASGTDIPAVPITDTEKDIKIYFPNARLNMDFHTFEWKQIYSIAHFIKKYKRGGNRFSFIGIKNTDTSDQLNPFPFTNAVLKSDFLYALLSSLINLKSNLLSIIVLIVSLCIVFCLRIKLKIYTPKITLPLDAGHIDPIKIMDFDPGNICFHFCPFGWLPNLFSQLPSGGRGFMLQADGCGPEGDGWELNLFACNDVSQNYCDTVPTENLSCDGTCFYIKGCAPNNSPIGLIGFGVPLTDQIGITNAADNNACLQILKAWECCAKFNLAEDRDLIKKIFNDSWVFGTAYLNQFKYATTTRGKSRKEKFCGPGADNASSDGYKKNQCCLDTKPGDDDCQRCLLRGPGKSKDRGNNSAAYNYHISWHNTASGYAPSINVNVTNGVVRARYPFSGAVDIDDIIYCNALTSTKIVSLGSIEMCDETLEIINNTIQVSNILTKYTQTSDFYTGTFYEKGWDSNVWANALKETSYQDPREVFLYLLNNTKRSAFLTIGTSVVTGLVTVGAGALFTSSDCVIDKLFNDKSGCHEKELENDPFFYIKEVSKIYTTIETSIDPTIGSEVFNPFGNGIDSVTAIDQPMADLPNINEQNSDGNPPAYGGFSIDLNSANRFSPCGGGDNQACVPYTTTYGRWNGTSALSWPNMGPGSNSNYVNMANNPNTFDRQLTKETRNNNNTRVNIPYYYFGINPGKTAINRLKKDFFLIK